MKILIFFFVLLLQDRFETKINLQNPRDSFDDRLLDVEAENLDNVQSEGGDDLANSALEGDTEMKNSDVGGESFVDQETEMNSEMGESNADLEAEINAEMEESGAQGGEQLQEDDLDTLPGESDMLDAEQMGDEEAPVEGDMEGEGEVPVEGEALVEGEKDEGQQQTEGEQQVEGEGEEPVEGEVPVEGEEEQEDQQTNEEQQQQQVQQEKEEVELSEEQLKQKVFRLFQSLAQQLENDFLRNRQQIIQCIEDIRDYLYSNETVLECVGHQFRRVINGIDYFKKKMFYQIEQDIRKYMIKGCYQPASRSKVMIEFEDGCDCLERDVLDLLWQEHNFHQVIQVNNILYTQIKGQLSLDHFYEIVSYIKINYENLQDIYESIEEQYLKSKADIKSAIDEKSDRIRKEVQEKLKSGETDKIEVKRKVHVTQSALGMLPPENSPEKYPIEKIPSLVVMDGRDKLFTGRENPLAKQLRHIVMSLHKHTLGSNSFILDSKGPLIAFRKNYFTGGQLIQYIQQMEFSKKYRNYLKGTADLISPVDVKKLIVVEIGSCYIRVGFSGENSPIFDLPFVVMKSKNQDTNDLTQTKLPNIYGKQTFKYLEDKSEDYNIFYPMTENLGLQKQIQEIENFLKYVFEDLFNVETNILELMVVDSIVLGDEFRIKLMEMLFEQLRVQSVNFMNSAVCSLFISGRTSGISVEFGNNSSNIVPIYEGFVLKHSLSNSNAGGQDATNLINEYLKEKDINLYKKKLNPLLTIQQIKSQIATVSLNYEQEVQDGYELDIEEICYELPDGQVIEFNNQIKFNCGEILLRPFLQDNSERNFTERILKSIKKTENCLKNQFAKNILISGGASQTRNLTARIYRDLNEKSKEDFPTLQFEITEEQHRPHSGWIGGSLIGSIQTFQNHKIKKSDFEECGDSKYTFLFKKTI